MAFIHLLLYLLRWGFLYQFVAIYLYSLKNLRAYCPPLLLSHNCLFLIHVNIFIYF